MGLFTQENRIKCGRCNTEFDLNRNISGCPLCSFGNKIPGIEPSIVERSTKKNQAQNTYLAIPPELKLKSGNAKSDPETNIWGAWLMFNDFCAPKFVTRVLAWKLAEQKKEHILLKDLMESVVRTIKEEGLSQFKGFPNLEKDRKGTRLVNHFLQTFVKMGLVEVRPTSKSAKNIWSENWDKIEITLTGEGLEFSRLRNTIFDEGKVDQILTPEEKNWLVGYLKRVDKDGYKEYSVLKEVYGFLQEGNKDYDDLIQWFKNNKKFKDYIHQRSERAKKDPKVFEQQLINYARTFTSAKISLLRELGVVKDKRNDYTIIGEL